MNDQMEVLLQQELDGVNTPAEQELLAEAIREDPSIQARLDEYRGLGLSLAGLPQAEPSADFTDRVMAGLPARRLVGVADRAAVSKRFSIRELLVGPRIRLAYAFVLGAFLAVAGTLTIITPSIDTRDVAGTLVNQAERTVEVGPVALIVASGESGIRISGQVESDLEILFSRPEGIPVRSWSWDGSPEPRIAWQGSTFTLTGGEGAFAVTLDGIALADVSIVARRAGLEVGRLQ